MAQDVRPSRVVLYASHSVKLDATFGANTGTDVTAGLQTLLDIIGAAGGGTLIIDGVGLVSGTLSYWSGTTIECPAGCGLTLADNANTTLWRNKHPTTNPDDGTGTPRTGDLTIIDKNVSFIGGIYNGNGTNNTMFAGGDWNCLIYAEGIEGLTIQNVELLEPQGMACKLSNWKNVSISNLRIHRTSGRADGLHVNGPGQRLVARNLRLHTFDDGFSLAPNDTLARSGDPSAYGTRGGPGDIVDVLIDGVTFEGTNGFRLLSTTNLLDQVKILNLSGSCQTQLMLMDNFTPAPSAMGPPGAGNFGSITIDGVEVDQTSLATGIPGYLWINSAFGTLTIQNVRRRNPTVTIPTVYFDANASATQPPIIRDVTYDAPSESSFPAIVKTYGTLSTLIVESVSVNRGTKLADASAVIVAGGSVDTIKIRGMSLDRVAYAISHTGGTLNAIDAVGVRQTNASGGYAVNLTAGMKVRDVLLSGYSGLLPITTSGGSTAPCQRGDGFTSTPVYPVRSYSPFTITANNTALTSAYPDEGPQWAIDEGTWIVTSNKAKATGGGGGGYAHAKVDTGVTNHTLTVTLSAHTTGDSRVMVRYTDQNNGVFVVITTTTFQIYEGISGSFSTLSSQVAHGVTTSSPFGISVSVSGTAVSAIINGHTITGTLAGNTSATKVGIGTNDLGTTFASMLALAP